MSYSGNLSIYFPCEIKGCGALCLFEDAWNRTKRRIIHDIHLRKAPLTDWMDLRIYQEDRETTLKLLQGKISDVGEIEKHSSPYALPCLQDTYRQSRESNIFSKNASVVVSRFQMSYCKIPHPVEGLLLYNVNAGNKVATYIAMLSFNNLTVDEIILLKHIFYKRLTVSIEEYRIKGYATCPCKRNPVCWCSSNNCSLRQPFQCVTEDRNAKESFQTSFQQYVADKDRYVSLNHSDVDYRARYSLLELAENVISWQLKKELLGLLTADEGYKYASWQKIETSLGNDLSVRSCYSYYQYGQNGLIMGTKAHLYKKYHLDKYNFNQNLNIDNKYIENNLIRSSCAAGAQEKIFPAYLKAVELHYLINRVLTNETGRTDKSYINPLIFISRFRKLWHILYDLDMNISHTNHNMNEAFGITKAVAKIRDEYKLLLQHIMNFMLFMIAMLQLIVAFILRK